jgi:hypothetical protein
MIIFLYIRPFMVGITAIPASDSKLMIRTDTKPYSQTRKQMKNIG